MIKVARLISVDDTGNLRFCMVSALGRPDQKAQLITPYGIMSNPPTDSMAVVLAQQGQESNLLAMADDPNNRTLRDLKTGEIAIGNYITGDYIFFDENGTLNIKVSTDVIANIDGDAQITATNVNIISDTLKHNGVNIGDDHTHGGIEPGSSSTLGPS